MSAPLQAISQSLRDHERSYGYAGNDRRKR